MNTDWTPESLAAFEADIANEFNAGNIRAPIHLAGGNEQQLLDVFRRIRPTDWKCGTWRFHYHALLSGVPPAELKAAIMAGRSIALCFPEHRVICSAMVGGIAPIALGLAWAAKRENGFPRRRLLGKALRLLLRLVGGGRRVAEHFPPGAGRFVWCFIGDMAAASGIVHECDRYARGHDLPLRFVVEDNGKSVATDTASSWGYAKGSILGHHAYKSELTWPHVGTGTFVHFPDKAEHRSHGL